jgi:hypothetical protein
MKTVRAYITGFLTIATILIAVIVAMPAFAAHTDYVHEATYYGAPGDELHGQVVVMNPSNEAKVIEVTVEKSHEEHYQWVFPDQNRYNLAPKGKAVITYKVIIPKQAKEDCTQIIHIREISPKNTLSIKQVVSVFITKPAAVAGEVTEINIFYTAFFIMLIVAFGLGLAFCAVIFVKKIPHLWNGHTKKKAG